MTEDATLLAQKSEDTDTASGSASPTVGPTGRYIIPYHDPNLLKRTPSQNVWCAAISTSSVARILNLGNKIFRRAIFTQNCRIFLALQTFYPIPFSWNENIEVEGW